MTKYTSITANMTEKERYAYWAKIRRKETIAIVVFASVVAVTMFILMAQELIY